MGRGMPPCPTTILTARAVCATKEPVREIQVRILQRLCRPGRLPNPDARGDRCSAHVGPSTIRSAGAARGQAADPASTEEGGSGLTVAGAMRLVTASVRAVVNVETLLLCEAEVGPYRPEADVDWMRPAGEADLPALAKLCGGRRTLRKRLARGDRAFVAELDGALCACVWLTTKPLRLARYGLHVDATPMHPYSYGLHVMRASRRRGVGTALAYHVRDVEAPRLGFTSVRYHISPRNPATIRRHLAEPRARTVRELRLVVVFGLFGRVVRDEPPSPQRELGAPIEAA